MLHKGQAAHTQAFCVRSFDACAAALPAQLLLPVGPLERAGSESLQGVLDKQIAPVLELWREGYSKWAARQ